MRRRKTTTMRIRHPQLGGDFSAFFQPRWHVLSLIFIKAKKNKRNRSEKKKAKKNPPPPDPVQFQLSNTFFNF
jgi:hypothetical protein